MNTYKNVYNEEEDMYDFEEEEEEQNDKSNSQKTVIHNLVVYCNLKCELDLYKIAQLVKFSNYDPHKSPGLTLKIKNPRSTAKIFHKGGMSITGVKTEEEGFKAAKKFGKIIKKLNYNVCVKKIEIKNIMATSCCNFEVDIQSVSSDSRFKNVVQYNPEIFSGIRVKILINSNNRIRANVYASGKMNVCGCKTNEELQNAIEYVVKMMKNHERKADLTMNNCETHLERVEIEKVKEKKKKRNEKKKNDPFFGKKPNH